MKRNKVAKRFGIASLCLATAVSAISGASLLNKDVAVAENLTSVKPYSLITATPNATVTYEDGVRISSDTKYEAQLNYTFEENTTLNFYFPETYSDWYAGNFVVRVTDAADASNYFEVVYGAKIDAWGYAYTSAWVKYNGAYYTSKYYESATAWYNTQSYGVNTNVAPSILGRYGTVNTTRMGYLGFEWDSEGKLSVVVNRASGDTSANRTIAKFDDTVADGFVSGTSWGLPKMDFDNGYKLSFSSEFTNANTTDTATDVLFTSIEHSTTNATQTYDLAGEATANAETITIADRGTAFETVEVGNELTIPAATYGESNTALENVQIVEPDGTTETVAANGKYTVAQKGVHTVTYTTTAGDVAAFSFTAKEYIDTKNLVHTSATVTQDENGLRISSDEAYKATLKGVFNGDTTLKFRFPEVYTGAEDDWWGGDFKVRVADATDETEYFEVYYRADDRNYEYTGAWVTYGNEVRTSKYYTENSGVRLSRNTFVGGEFAIAAPAFRSYYNSNAFPDRNTREGILSFVWVDDVLQVNVNTMGSNGTATRTIAAFDGTEAFVANDMANWGLPKLSFANGYVISVSSSFSYEGVEDKGTDVLFTSITNGASVYDFKTSEVEKDENLAAFDNAFEALTTAQTETGEVFLGWKATDGKLFPAYSVLKKQAGVSYEAVVLGFDTINGASVRIDTSADGKSGIRFQTLFNVEEYAVAQGYIKSFGTLIAYTETLTTAGKDFTIENYTGETTFAQVANSKGTFEYTDKGGNTYTAYSMALVDIVDYTKAYSARGYIEVQYADGTTEYIYTDYNEADNSRSIQQVAQNLIATDAAAYEAMTTTQKAIIDGYAAGNAQ